MTTEGNTQPVQPTPEGDSTAATPAVAPAVPTEVPGVAPAAPQAEAATPHLGVEAKDILNGAIVTIGQRVQGFADSGKTQRGAERAADLASKGADRAGKFAGRLAARAMARRGESGAKPDAETPDSESGTH